MNPELPADHADTATVRNDLPHPIVLAIEPSRDVYWLDPGKSVVVTAVGPAGGTLEVVGLSGRIEVFLWVGATGQLREADSDQLVDDFPIPFPLVPKGTTLVDFVHMMNNHTAWHEPPAERRIGQVRKRLT